MQTITAKLKYLNISPRKTRLVANILKGLRVNEAEAELLLSQKRPSAALLKLLHSAVANAKHNYKLDTAKLYIKEIRVDQGSKFRRWMPRARGSVSPIEKKTSHVALVLGFKDTLPSPKFILREKPKKATAEKKEKKRKLRKAEEKPKEQKVVREAKPTSKPGFFQRVFRRKSI